jgi:hypothetical protein
MNKAGIIASIIGGIAVLGGLIYVFVTFEFRLNAFDARLITLEARVNAVEAQQKVIRAAPEVIVQDKGALSQPKPNPLIETCLGLIRDETEAAKRTDVHSENIIKVRMGDLDCSNVLKAQAPK